MDWTLIIINMDLGAAQSMNTLTAQKCEPMNLWNSRKCMQDTSEFGLVRLFLSLILTVRTFVFAKRHAGILRLYTEKVDYNYLKKTKTCFIINEKWQKVVCILIRFQTVRSFAYVVFITPINPLWCYGLIGFGTIRGICQSQFFIQKIKQRI